MKLLLTSNGICNQTLADALAELASKKPGEVKVAFIPTAVNVETGNNKDWFIAQLTDLQKFGFTQINIVEIAAMGIDWREKLDNADVVYAGGGNPYYLLDVMRKVEFDTWFKQNIDKKVYVGGSSGAIVMTPSVRVATIKTYESRNAPSITDLTALNYVDFELAPHVPDWPSLEEVAEYAKTTPNAVYAIDNQTGIQVKDDELEIISEGSWKRFN